MRFRKALRLPAICIGAIAALFSTAITASAQTDLQRTDALMRQLKGAQSSLGKQEKYISGGLRTVLNLANHWDLAELQAAQAAMRATASATGTLGPIGLASRITGFTQSETSTAWCGANAVIGFNDTGSFLETEAAAVLGTGGVSILGY